MILTFKNVEAMFMASLMAIPTSVPLLKRDMPSELLQNLEQY